MMAFIKSGFTTAQGELDDARVAAMLLVLAYIGSTFYTIYQGQPFNYKDFGIGVGALSAGVGCWFGIRKEN